MAAQKIAAILGEQRRGHPPRQRQAEGELVRVHLSGPPGGRHRPARARHAHHLPRAVPPLEPQEPAGDDPRPRLRLDRRRRLRQRAGRPAGGRQGGRRAHRGHRLRPRGRAHRPRGAADPARGRPAAPPGRRGQKPAAQGQGPRPRRRRRRPRRAGKRPASSTSSPCCRPASSTGTTGCATRRSSPRTCWPRSPSRSPWTSTSPTPPAPARTSTCCGARCSAASSRWPSYRYGASFLSVGRVQTPTLRLIVERERERLAFVPVPYWEVWAELERGADRVTAGARPRPLRRARRRPRRPWPARTPTWRVVTAYEAKPRAVRPPAPFNTTGLMSAASGTGVAPARAMRAAESLYLAGLISYPRTDNTVYPKSLDLHARGRHAARLVAGGRAWPPACRPRPSSRPRAATSAPPTTRRSIRWACRPAPLAGDQAKVYELVVRRFLATLMPPATIESQRLDVRVGTRAVRGSRQPRGRARLPGGLREVHRLARAAAASGRRRRRVRGAGGAAGRQGDAAAGPLRAGLADREDGGPGPRHQGHPRRHHPAALRPHLRARQPGRAHRPGHGPHRGVRRRASRTPPSTSPRRR